MCWLYLRTTQKTRPVSNHYLRKFYSKGGDLNPDGWGITSYMAKAKDFTLMKEPTNASDSMVAHAVSVQSGLPKTRAVIAHVRKKSCGKVSYRNTQPMLKRSEVTGEMWAFAHNGSATQEQIDELKEDVKENCSYKPVTQLDSELLFIEFMDCIDRIMKPKDESRETFKVIHEFLKTLNEYTKMCVVATNGELCFAYRDMKGQRFLHLLKDKVGYVTSTQPLTSGPWKSLSPGQMLVFKRGKLIYNSHYKQDAGKKVVAQSSRSGGYQLSPYKQSSYKYDFAFPKDEYLMGRDNFHDEAEEMGLWDDLDQATRSDGRRDYDAVLLEDGQDGHSFTTIGEHVANKFSEF